MTVRAAERVWLLLGEDGRHALLGRHRELGEDEILQCEARLAAQGLGGWLAICIGDRWSRRGRVALEAQRPLAGPSVAFEVAAERFETERRERLAALS